ncbi:hypothetical protein [Algoriphagus machipongonensis]|uniref:Class I SAM-dependent methyltransferase n=1 Tax=Algoriphagus machipongonensis TaxID=388413 RepID=A3I1B6_9BACT|nr:hypothetical protein [Algoriphagus machipongonensis]EAZ79582.1 hypothetical protein ALPR1_08158 [Algoriphagus machipongonensis]
MSRIHLFEFEDQKWFPAFLRNYGTDFLQFLANKTRMFVPLIPWIEKGLSASKTQTIIDLASGGGGGILSLNQELLEKNPNIKILLTDYFPNLSAFDYCSSQASNISFAQESVDARNVPKYFEGLRTQFLSLHHFQPKDAIKILGNAVEAKEPIFIAEGQERSIPSFLAMFFSPITVLFVTPFIRPFSWRRILFTYLIPIVSLFVWWDGMVSCLRTYSIAEMNQLVTQVKNKDEFDWEVGKVKSGPASLLFLLGIPKN